MGGVYLGAGHHLVADDVVGVGRVPLATGDARGRDGLRHRATQLVALRLQLGDGPRRARGRRRRLAGRSGMKLLRGRSAGVVAAFGFSLYGLLLNPQMIKQMFNLPDELMYKANVAVGWLSPLNQATYHMHNFGYDLLPRLWQTYAIFGGMIALLMVGILLAIRRYNFMFLGTEQS